MRGRATEQRPVGERQRERRVPGFAGLGGLPGEVAWRSKQAELDGVLRPPPQCRETCRVVIWIPGGSALRSCET